MSNVSKTIFFQIYLYVNSPVNLCFCLYAELPLSRYAILYHIYMYKFPGICSDFLDGYQSANVCIQLFEYLESLGNRFPLPQGMNEVRVPTKFLYEH